VCNKPEHIKSKCLEQEDSKKDAKKKSFKKNGLMSTWEDLNLSNIGGNSHLLHGKCKNSSNSNEVVNLSYLYSISEA